MKFRFALDRIHCNNTLTSKKAPLGERDCLDLLFIVEVGLQRYVFQPKGDYPAPDDFLDIGKGDVRSGIQLGGTGGLAPVFENVEIDTSSSVTISVFGYNRGQAYVGGGGGGPTASAFVAALGVIGIGKPLVEVMKLFKQALATEQCIGTAFIFSKSLNGAELIASSFTSRVALPITFSKADSQITIQPQSACNVPDYSALVYVKRTSALGFVQHDRVTLESRTSSEELVPGVKSCVPAGTSPQVWADLFDREFSITKSFTLPSGFSSQWTVLGVALTGGAGRVVQDIEVEKQPNGKRALSRVTVDWVIDGIGNLVLKTQGADGNFDLEVIAQIVGPTIPTPMPVERMSIDVMGSVENGDEVWFRYKVCVYEKVRRLLEILYVKRDPGSIFDPVKFVLPEKFDRELLKQTHFMSSIVEAVSKVLKIPFR